MIYIACIAMISDGKPAATIPHYYYEAKSTTIKSSKSKGSSKKKSLKEKNVSNKQVPEDSFYAGKKSSEKNRADMVPEDFFYTGTTKSSKVEKERIKKKKKKKKSLEYNDTTTRKKAKTKLMKSVTKSSVRGSVPVVVIQV